MWGAVAQVGIQLATTYLKGKAELEAAKRESKAQRERLEMNMNRSSEVRGANYQKLREQHLANIASINEANEEAQSEADLAMEYSNISGISRNDIDREIARDTANAELQATREATEAIQHSEYAQKQEHTNNLIAAKNIAGGGYSKYANLASAAELGSSAVSAFSKSFSNKTFRPKTTTSKEG